MSEEPKAFVAVPQSSPSGHWAVQNTASGLYAASYCTEEDARAFAATPDLLEVAKELKELFRFALLSTSPAIAKDGMEFIRKAEAAIAKASQVKP